MANPISLLKISGVLSITQTAGYGKYYAATAVASAKFIPSSDGSSIFLTIGGDNYTIRYFDLNVNGQSATTLSEALILLNSIFEATPASYLVYTALLNQSGTNAPVATVLENTLGGTVVWTRTDVGTYVATLVGAFTENKTTTIQEVVNQNDIEANTINISGVRTGNNTYSLSSGAAGVGGLDDVINNYTIEIRVYP